MIVIKSTDTESIRPFVNALTIPSPASHKGQNGKLLVVGGSQLFHAASLWAAEVASHFVDMVHYASTEENNEIMHALKVLFRNGIVVPRSSLQEYAQEDDAILIGPGMVRTGAEAQVTLSLTKELLLAHPEKRFVLDAGALQVMQADWLTSLKEPAIVTPHQMEFAQLFGRDLSNMPLEEKARAVAASARAHNTVVLLKAVVDIISDGTEVYVVEGGNAGLTKGGTGDILAGIVGSFRTKNDPIVSAVLGSYILKRTADHLFQTKGTWYNNSDLIGSVSDVLHSLL